MAQVVGNSNDDWKWHHQWNAALLLLRELSNAWALEREVSAEGALAAVFRMLARPPEFAPAPTSAFLRLGCNLNLLKNMPSKLINELFILTQPGHLQKVERKALDADERDVVRADFIRRKLESH